MLPAMISDDHSRPSANCGIIRPMLWRSRPPPPAPPPLCRVPPPHGRGFFVLRFRNHSPRRSRLPLAPNHHPHAGAARPTGAAPPLALDEAGGLALGENLALRGRGSEREATRGNEVTGGLIPNPPAAFTSEKYGGPTFIERTLTIGQPPETGGKRRRRLDSA